MDIQVTPEKEQYKFSQFGEPYLYSINRNAFEKSNSATLFQSHFKALLDEEDYLYIVVGTDSGLLVDYVLEKSLPYGSKFIFIDLPQVIDTINEQLSFTVWDENVAICSIDEWQNIAEQFKIQSYLFTEKVRYLKSIAASDAYDSGYFDLDSNVSLTLEALQHQTMVSLSREPFIARQLENLSDNLFPLANLQYSFVGKTCVILGGGPSLDESIEWIKANKDNIVIIGVSRISNKLIDEGIVPHIMLSVDPHDVSFDVSKEMLALPKDVLFIHSSYVVPTLIGQWHGKHAYFGQSIPWQSKLNPDNVTLHGPTVTNSAISAAIELGFKQILLTGVDLSYASDGTTYAKGSNEAKVGPVLGMKGQWVETYSGRMAETSNSFLHATKILANQAGHAKNFGCEIVNLSENAAKVEGISHIPCEQIAFDQQNNIATIINDIPLLNTQEIVTANKALHAEIERVLTDLNDIYRIVKNALTDNHALYQEYKHKDKNHKIKLKLDKAEKKLDTRYEHISVFIKKFGIKNFIKTVQTDTEEEWSNEKMQETGRLYYQAYIDTVETLKPLFISAKKRIKSRIEELKPKPNFDLLIAQWQEDKQFKRAVNWQQQFPEKMHLIDELTQQAFDQLTDKYQAVLVNSDTAHFRRSQAEATLNGVNRKAVHLFQQQNQEGLAQLVDALSQLIDTKEEADVLHKIASGYHALLNNLFSKALAYFEQVPEEKRTEDEQLQMVGAAIELQQYDKAESLLARLSELFDNYKPKYATILKLNGKIELALDTYFSYLDKHRNDLSTWLDLGKMCIDINSLESASIAFDTMLSIDPDNAEAHYFKSQLEKL